MSIRTVAKTACEAFASLLYPPHCTQCKADVARRAYLCDACARKAKRIVSPFCMVCSQPFDGSIDGTFTCANCEHRNLHFDCAVSAYRSRGVVRDLIHRFKYQHHFYLRHPLADWLAETLEDPRIQTRTFDAIVPVPLHATRFREREFNQAEVLAKMIARRTGVPVLNDLRRTRNTTTQTRFDRAERMENLRNAFAMRHNADVQSKHLLLVDDVLTTGSTVDECSRVLRKAGAATIRVITVARG